MRTKRNATDYAILAERKNIKLVGDIPNTVLDKTTWQCVSGHQWQTSYHTIDRGSSCPYCAGTAAKTLGDYLSLASERGFTLVGDMPKRTGHTARWRCEKGHEWSARYTSIRGGCGCPLCAKSLRKTKADYDFLAESIGYKHMGDIPANTKEHTTWICDKGHEWITAYDSIRYGRKCAHCTGNARLTEDHYHQLAAERGFRFLGPYPKNVSTPVTWKCSQEHKWESAYYNIQSGRNCPMCSIAIHESNGEKAIAQALENLGIRYKKEHKFEGCRDKRPLPFDFYFEHGGKPFLCEYNGEQHYRPVSRFGGKKQFEGVVKRDQIKAKWAALNGYVLIMIGYNVQPNEIQEILQYILFDNDKAGKEGAAKVRACMRRASIVTLPEGVKDVGELWAAGYAATWLHEALR